MKTATIIRAGLWAVTALIAGGLFLAYLTLQNRTYGGDEPYGAPFTLVDQNGEPFGTDDMRGKPSALFFGYTHCPDVCPTTLYELAANREAIEAEGGDFRIVFVTVDPERDTPAVMKNYVESVSPDIVALSGEPEDVAAMAKGWGAYFAKSGEGEDYLMDHTATTFLLDASGRLAGTLAYGENPETVKGKLEKLAGV